MTRDEFHNQIKQWEKARFKWIVTFCGYILVMTFAMKHINAIYSFSIQTPLDAGLIIAGLSIPALLLFVGASNQAKKYNLICHKCKLPFEHYKQLTHIAFLNQCPKCGANVYSV